MQKINVRDKLSKITQHWDPKVIAELNGQEVKLARLKGEFVWHLHENEDELFYVLKGVLAMEFRDHTTLLHPGEMLVVPRGVEHRPVASEEVEILLFEPASTLNTGNTRNNFTRDHPEKI